MKKYKEKIFTNTIFVTAVALLCCALWGSATPFIKIGYELMLPAKDTPSIILFAGTRFTFAGIITILIYSIARRKFLIPKKENLIRIAIVSAFQTVIQYVFFYIGLANTTGVKGTVASGTNVFFAILIAGYIFRLEKVTVKKIVACLIGFAGMVTVNLKGLDLNMNFMGDAFVIFAAIAYAISSVLIKRYSNYEDPVVISGYQFVLGGLVMVLIGLVFGGSIAVSGIKAVSVLAYLSLLSAVAYSLWGILLKHNPVSRVTVYSFMISVFGVLFSTFMLEENSNVPVVNLILAVILVSTGVIMLNYKKD